MIATLHILAALRGDITYLKKSYFSSPLKLADITEDRRKKTLHIMQMTSSPGILDADQYRIKIELEEDCHMQLHTQSYQRLFSMKTEASQLMEVHLAKGSAFTYLPHPCVPQKDSNFTSRNKIYVSAGCYLMWGEIVTCGRKLSGERFMFSKYSSITEIFHDRKLSVKENICMVPKTTDLTSIGQLEGFTHQASLIHYGENANAPQIIKQAISFLESQPEIIFGITTASQKGLLVRILGNQSEQLSDCLKIISNLFTNK